MANEPWTPFGAPSDRYNFPGQGGRQWVNLSLRRPRGESGRARGSRLISTAAALLGLLAAGLFVVSLAAQYRYILSEKGQAIPSMIEAVGLDVGMAIFSLLALGLAMAGQAARIERVLIVACALGSAAMNYAAANGGSPRSVAAYVMPPLFLAIVVDRVVAVIRRHVLGAGDSAWVGAGRIALYGLRFLLAAPSTARGLRQQVLVMTPLPGAGAPAALPPASEPSPCLTTGIGADDTCVSCGRIGNSEPVHAEVVAAEATVPGRERPGRHRGDSKTAQFLRLVTEHHGPLAGIDRTQVSRISSELAPLVDLHTGSARSVLGQRIRAAQNGHSS